MQIKMLKNNKSPVEDGIQAELLKKRRKRINQKDMESNQKHMEEREFTRRLENCDNLPNI